jgi:hypothetical protein
MWIARIALNLSSCELNLWRKNLEGKIKLSGANPICDLILAQASYGPFLLLSYFMHPDRSTLNFSPKTAQGPTLAVSLSGPPFFTV